MYFDAFPNLRHEHWSAESPVTVEYNCIAWAADDDQRWWWPDRFDAYFWPVNVPREETIEAFVEAFKTLGYSKCRDGSHQRGIEKIAIYALNGTPTHAARQKGKPYWTSKLGEAEDIEHTLAGLEGPKYGRVAQFMMRRTLPDAPSLLQKFIVWVRSIVRQTKVL